MSEIVTVAWASDVHLDHASPEDILGFFARVGESGAEHLLLGGDITHACQLERTLREIVELTRLPLHFVLGNHDYYGASIALVRDQMAALDLAGANWLPATGPRVLAPGLTLVGHGGWGDARMGSFVGSPVFLSDYIAIEELAQACDLEPFDGRFGEGTALERKLNRLGEDAAATLSPQLLEAAARSRHVLILTHVPPFPEACWHEGRISDEWWLPAFGCAATGNLIGQVARDHPDCRFTILCGHTHGEGVASIAPNVIAYTQAASYAQPGFQVLEVGADSFRIRA